MWSLEKTTSKVDGRYQVGLIWKDLTTNLPDNRAVPETRLHLLERRLESDPELNVKYRQTIDDDLQKGYIKKLCEQELSQANPRVWYLPHRQVLNPHKPGKVRRVSDAATKYRGTSLNGNMSRNAHNNKNGKKENLLANLANMVKMTILPQSPTRQSTKQ